MTGALIPWLFGAVLVAAYLYRCDRRMEEAAKLRQSERETETARMLAEFDRLDAERVDDMSVEGDDPPPDPLAEIEAELEYVRELVADLRKEREQTAAPALANPPAAAMVMVPSERP
jgi:hypothetical protein